MRYPRLHTVNTVIGRTWDPNCYEVRLSQVWSAKDRHLGPPTDWQPPKYEPKERT